MEGRTRMARIFIGISGWHYDHWIGTFYPAGTKSVDFLRHYARHFRAVEINNTFYRLPKPETLAKWHDDSPKSMIFACKASRYITHVKKLQDEQSFARFFQVMEALGPKLGPLLFQLPPRWKVNVERLDAFLQILPPDRRCAFEFRDPSWFVPEVRDVLQRHGVACCLYDFEGQQSPLWLTADFVYLRLHGPGRRYLDSYDERTLLAVAHRLRAWKREGRDAYCFFDNTDKGHATRDALRLQQLLRQSRSRALTKPTGATGRVRTASNGALGVVRRARAE
jgi:uncharacterized protein YecE (DUF72 family)